MPVRWSHSEVATSPTPPNPPATIICQVGKGSKFRQKHFVLAKCDLIPGQLAALGGRKIAHTSKPANHNNFPGREEDLSFRALSGRLKFTVQRHKFNKDSLLSEGEQVPTEIIRVDQMRPDSRSERFLPNSPRDRQGRSRRRHHQPSELRQIVFSNRLDLYCKTQDSRERQCKSRA